MKTIILKIKKKPEKIKIRQAADILKNGGIVAFPTDTVYGLAVNALNSNAKKKVYKLKGRSFKKPLIIMPKDTNSLRKIAVVGKSVEKLIRKYWPGPLTLILSTNKTGRMIMGGRSDLGVRIPDNNVALSLLETCDFPVATTSANPSGKPSAKTGKEAARYFKNKVDLIIDSGECKKKIESTVLNATRFPFSIVRQGCISREKIESLMNI
ncbi:MAG: threonylcarbamoyl-AMP synthase [Endomicrobiales bacterium]|nr:threonylcarbamoyl-AMP synthase [Endomicrobiales bacterium]